MGVSDARESQPLLGTGDMARLSESTLRTVRFYEAEGLLQPVRRSDAGRRLFSRQQLTRLRFILDLREAGLSLQAIKDVLAAKESAAGPHEAAQRLQEQVDAQLEAIAARMARLRRLRGELAATRATLDECRGCVAEDFPRACEGCELMKDEALPRAMRVLWGA
ncbi:MAG: MerR family transcriptional regulator [Myxococcota bacterium]